MQKRDTIIIGGGMAGLGCARTLTDARYDNFALLSEDIGGSVCLGADTRTNYGAFYVREDYKHIKKYVHKTRRLRPSECRFFRNGRRIPYIHWRSIPHLFSLMRLYFFLKKYKRNYMKFRKLSETKSQKAVINQVPFFQHMYTTPATEFIKKLGCEYWADNFINPIYWATAFSDISDATGASLGTVSLPFIVPSHEFILDIKKLTRGFEENIHQDTVLEIQRAHDTWIIKTKNGNTWSARHVALAVPTHIAKKLISIPEKTNTPQRGHLLHIRGTLKPPYNTGAYIFIDAPGLYMATKQYNGTILFIAEREDTDLEQYFSEYKIIGKKAWDPAFVIGKHVIESDRGDKMYVIGGHNAPTMEDAFITGIYAANQILK